MVCPRTLRLPGVFSACPGVVPTEGTTMSPFAGQKVIVGRDESKLNDARLRTASDHRTARGNCVTATTADMCEAAFAGDRLIIAGHFLRGSLGDATGQPVAALGSCSEGGHRRRFNVGAADGTRIGAAPVTPRRPTSRSGRWARTPATISGSIPGRSFCAGWAAQADANDGFDRRGSRRTAGPRSLCSCGRTRPTLTSRR